MLVFNQITESLHILSAWREAMSIADSGNIIRILSGCNRWWQFHSVSPDYLKATHRTLFGSIRQQLSKDVCRVIYIAGLHRSGKTALIHQVIQSMIDDGEDPRQILYLDFEHPFLNFVSFDLLYRTFYENVCSDPQKRTFCFIDDAHMKKDWEKEIIRFSKQYPELTVIAASTIRPENIGPESVFFHLPPVSYYEYCQIANKSEDLGYDSIAPLSGFVNASRHELLAISRYLGKFRPNFIRYLYTGGFLNLVGETDPIRIQRMIQKHVVSATLGRDISSTCNVRNTSELERVFLYLCFECPGVISFEALKREVDCVSRPTIEKYMHYLNRACMILHCLPDEAESGPIQKIQPKIYLADSSIRNSLLMLDDVRVTETDLNRIVETAVYRHLRFFGPDMQEGRITYSRKKTSGKNLDMILTGQKKRIFIDIRYDDELRFSKKDSVILNSHEADICLVITKSDRYIGPVSGLPSNIICIPANVFLFLIGHAKANNYSFLDGV